VDEEWSFIQTLRHLVFVIDAWVSRTVLGAENHYHPLGLGMEHSAFAVISVDCGLDVQADPTLEEVVDAHASRMAVVRDLLDRLRPEELEQRPASNPSVGFPKDTTLRTTLQCLWTALSEEWWHHLFATRDLEQIEKRELERGS
jgi:hypothetical protein